MNSNAQVYSILHRLAVRLIQDLPPEYHARVHNAHAQITDEFARAHKLSDDNIPAGRMARQIVAHMDAEDLPALIAFSGSSGAVQTREF